jgi:hypothetical protein
MRLTIARAETAPAVAGGGRDGRPALIEAVEEQRQVGGGDPGPSSVTLTSTRSSRRRAASVTVLPAGQNLSALSTQVGDRPLEQLDVDPGVRRRRAGAVGDRQCPEDDALPCRALGKAQGDVVEQLAHVDGLEAQAVFGLVELGQVAERAHHRGGVAGIAQRDLDQGGGRRRARRCRPSGHRAFPGRLRSR